MPKRANVRGLIVFFSLSILGFLLYFLSIPDLSLPFLFSGFAKLLGFVCTTITSFVSPILRFPFLLCLNLRFRRLNPVQFNAISKPSNVQTPPNKRPFPILFTSSTTHQARPPTQRQRYHQYYRPDERKRSFTLREQKRGRRRRRRSRRRRKANDSNSSSSNSDRTPNNKNDDNATTEKIGRRPRLLAQPRDEHPPEPADDRRDAVVWLAAGGED